MKKMQLFYIFPVPFMTQWRKIQTQLSSPGPIFVCSSMAIKDFKQPRNKNPINNLPINLSR